MSELNFKLILCYKIWRLFLVQIEWKNIGLIPIAKVSILIFFWYSSWEKWFYYSRFVCEITENLLTVLVDLI